jgi:hypothetical protein
MSTFSSVLHHKPSNTIPNHLFSLVILFLVSLSVSSINKTKISIKMQYTTTFIAALFASAALAAPVDTVTRAVTADDVNNTTCANGAQPFAMVKLANEQLSTGPNNVNVVLCEPEVAVAMSTVLTNFHKITSVQLVGGLQNRPDCWLEGPNDVEIGVDADAYNYARNEDDEGNVVAVDVFEAELTCYWPGTVKRAVKEE